MLRLRRLRQPRYLLVGFGLVIYVGSMVFNRSQMRLRIPDNYESAARIATGLLFFSAMAVSWVFGVAASLQFTLAEVNFLFTAPLARQTLLQYKIARLLVTAGGVALFFTLMLGPVQPLAAALFAFKTAVIMWVFGLFEAGTSLYRMNAKTSDGVRAQTRLSIVGATFALMVLAAWTLAVFAFADGAQILRVLPVVLLLLTACVVWILGSDAAFEEEAAINAEKVQAALRRLQNGQRPATTGARSRRATRGTLFRLAPTGPTETAILWKNWLLFGRVSPRAIGVAIFVVVGIVVGASFAAGGLPAWNFAPFLFLVLAGAIAVMGPAMMRSDLRRDLVHLALLKTWPVTGAAIVRGEILAPAIALSIGTAVALFPAAMFVPAKLLGIDTGIAARSTFVLAALCCAVAVIVAQLVIQNAIAVTFPAWVRPKVGAGAAVEGMGQGMVVLYGGILVLMLGALAPAAAAGVVMFLAGGILLPALVFSSLLLLESYAATEIVGRILDRTDLQDVEVSR